MLVVSDTEDMFVPLVDGFLVNVAEAKSVIEKYAVKREREGGEREGEREREWGIGLIIYCVV